MFELNKIFIKKIGWADYTYSAYNSKIRLNFKDPIPYNQNISFWIRNSDNLFLIAESIEKEKKQNKVLEYKFIICKDSDNIDYKNSKSIIINSNLELMKLIMHYEACNEEYQRHFKLTKLLK